MAKKVKKQTSSMPFSLSRWFRRISTAQPSTFILSIIISVSAVFLFGGGLYTVIMHPIIYAYYSNRFYFIFSRSLGGTIGEQFGAESIISNALYMIGLIGLLVIYQSTKYAYKPRQAYMMLIIGVALLFIAYIFLEDVMNIKLFE